jgi:hypothetical protein
MFFLDRKLKTYRVKVLCYLRSSLSLCYNCISLMHILKVSKAYLMRIPEVTVLNYELVAYTFNHPVIYEILPNFTHFVEITCFYQQWFKMITQIRTFHLHFLNFNRALHLISLKWSLCSWMVQSTIRKWNPLFFVLREFIKISCKVIKEEMIIFNQLF